MTTCELRLMRSLNSPEEPNCDDGHQCCKRIFSKKFYDNDITILFLQPALLMVRALPLASSLWSIILLPFTLISHANCVSAASSCFLFHAISRPFSTREAMAAFCSSQTSTLGPVGEEPDFNPWTLTSTCAIGCATMAVGAPILSRLHSNTAEYLYTLPTVPAEPAILIQASNTLTAGECWG